MEECTGSCRLTITCIDGKISEVMEKNLAGSFVVGDLVMLKSGGPIMTVTSIQPNYDKSSIKVSCQYDYRGEYRHFTGEPDTLVKA